MLLMVTLLNAVILWAFHDRYWYPTDEDIHAHLAQRLLSGEVIARDFQSLHPGYKFNHTTSARLMEQVRRTHARIAVISGVEVYGPA